MHGSRLKLLRVPRASSGPCCSPARRSPTHASGVVVQGPRLESCAFGLGIGALVLRSGVGAVFATVVVAVLLDKNELLKMLRVIQDPYVPRFAPILSPVARETAPQRLARRRLRRCSAFRPSDSARRGFGDRLLFRGVDLRSTHTWRLRLKAILASRRCVSQGAQRLCHRGGTVVGRCSVSVSSQLFCTPSSSSHGRGTSIGEHPLSRFRSSNPPTPARQLTALAASRRRCGASGGRGGLA